MMLARRGLLAAARAAPGPGAAAARLAGRAAAAATATGAEPAALARGAAAAASRRNFSADEGKPYRTADGGGKKEKKPKKTPSYQALASSLADISQADVSRYFQLKADDIERLLPEGFTPDSRDYFQILGNHLVMIRKSLIELIDLMRKIQDGDESAKKEAARLLTGERGMGKSLTMQLAVMWARSQGWIVLYVPDAHNFVTEMGAIEYGTGTGAPLSQSKLRPALMTQPIGSQKILNIMKETHGEQLAALKQQRKYPAKLYDSDDSLMGIVERGLKTAPYAGDALLDLRLELGLVTSQPVLVAVDEINAFSWPTVFSENAVTVVPERLMIAETFRFLDQDGGLREQLKLARGLLLGAPTSKFGYPMPPKVIAGHTKQLGTAPRYFAPFNVYGDEVEVKDPSILLPETRYTHDELRNVVITYKYCKSLDSSTALDPYKLKALMAITSGVPIEVHKFLWQPALSLYAEPHPDIRRPNYRHNYSVTRVG